MFLKTRLRLKIIQIAREYEISDKTLALIETCVDDVFPRVKAYGLDPSQGAIMVISHVIVQGQKRGILEQVKEVEPVIYYDLKKLWQLCGQLVMQNEDYYGNAVVVGEGNPFDA